MNQFENQPQEKKENLSTLDLEINKVNLENIFQKKYSEKINQKLNKLIKIYERSIQLRMLKKWICFLRRMKRIKTEQCAFQLQSPRILHEKIGSRICQDFLKIKHSNEQKEFVKDYSSSLKMSKDCEAVENGSNFFLPNHNAMDFIFHDFPTELDFNGSEKNKKSFINLFKLFVKLNDAKKIVYNKREENR